MAMTQNGLAKLIEECGEVLQVVGKMQQYPELQMHSVDELFKQHPDGKGDLRKRLEDEMGDLIAAIEFVEKKLKLNSPAIALRAIAKLALFKQWDKET